MAAPTWTRFGLLVGSAPLATVLVLLWFTSFGSMDARVLLTASIVQLAVAWWSALSYHRGDVPAYLRPPALFATASAIATIAAAFADTVVADKVLQLRVAESLGIVVGSLLWRYPRVAPIRIATPRLRASLATLLMVVGTLAAVVFFVRSGVPLLMGNVESARVEVTASGTGYLRLLAYMTIPSALTLWALNRTASLLRIAAMIAVPLSITLAFANRSPLIYLLGVLLVAAMLVASERTTRRGLAAGAMMSAVLVVALGVYRIVSQVEFANYVEYRDDLASGNYLGVAETSAEVYLGVLPQNAALTRSLVDNGAIPHQYGLSYLSLFRTALPGEQLTLDRQIRQESGAEFVGGGTPPTLAGEAYVNFGQPGPIIVPVLLLMLLNREHSRLVGTLAESGRTERRAISARYAFLLLWMAGAQVAGMTGASTVPLAAYILVRVLLRSDKPVEGSWSHALLAGRRPRS